MTPGAYLEGAYLLRRMTAEEAMQARALNEMIADQARRSQRDETITFEGIALKEVYPVGIDLQAAMENPGSDADIVLRDYDAIFIPQYNGTARVMGAVLYPNTITYKDGKSVKYYIKSSGGFDNTARKRRAFVIHMNGMVESGLSAKVKPGSIIIVPSKPDRNNNFDIGDAAQVLSSTASTAAVIIAALNLSK